ncbi:MAG: hypothetical protein PUG09_02295 [Prevotella sp.]|nr:hypothetical protein [Prevotella sp.]
MNNTFQIAILLTCHNRKTKTLASLASMFNSVDTYNKNSINIFKAHVFLTDDGCTDGTSMEVKKQFPDRDFTFIQGDGTLFWAQGMRQAWLKAVEESNAWDFFLLMNDDTIFAPSALQELMSTHLFALEHFGKGGIYSGITVSHDRKRITYGGSVYSSRLIGKAVILKPIGKPQLCKLTNANILLVDRHVQKSIGIFTEAYQHSCADWAYGMEASRRGFPVLVTGSICGYCDNDHGTESDECEKIMHMTVSQRKAYFASPLHSTSDILTFMLHYQKLKYVLVLIARQLNIYFPKIYYKLSSKRKSTL